jgi:hypothetical protein
MIPKTGSRFSVKIMLESNQHDAEKWEPVFGQDHVRIETSMIAKSGSRFSAKIMLE